MICSMHYLFLLLLGLFNFFAELLLFSVPLLSGHSCVEDQLDFSCMATVFTTTMHDRICLALCRPLSSLATWPASAMHSS